MHTKNNSRLWPAMLMALMLSPHFAAAQTCPATITPTTSSRDFTLNGDGTVTHNPTGLMWMACSQGATWDGSNCSGTPGTYTWSDALKQAASSQFAGYTDWRVPNKNELASIVERSCYSPAINSRIFPATPTSSFWSSSPFAGHSYDAWNVSFGDGPVSYDRRSSSYAVRLVRGGQSLGSLPTNPPAVSFAAIPDSVSYNGNSTLQWSSTGATSCKGDWNSNIGTSGTEQVNSLKSNQTYTLTCTGSGGATTKTATINVATKPTPTPSNPPTVSLTATPTTVKPGESTTLTWSSTHATSCKPSGDWSGTIGISGTSVMSGLSSNKSYSLTCTGEGGSASQAVTVAVTAITVPPTAGNDIISCVFSYFEANYPQYYAPANTSLIPYGKSTYRYYTATDSLLVYSPTDDTLYGGYGYYGYGYYYGYYYLKNGTLTYWKNIAIAAGCK